jgi:hypothetical protein
VGPEVSETKRPVSLKTKPTKGNSYDTNSLDIRCLHRTEHSAHHLGSAERCIKRARFSDRFFSRQRTVGGFGQSPSRRWLLSHQYRLRGAGVEGAHRSHRFSRSARNGQSQDWSRHAGAWRDAFLQHLRVFENAAARAPASCASADSTPGPCQCGDSMKCLYVLFDAECELCVRCAVAIG